MFRIYAYHLAILLLMAELIVAVGDMDDNLWLDDFEKPSSDRWRLAHGWRIVQDQIENHILVGVGHAWAEPIIHEQCYSYTIQMKVRLITGRLHINFRQSHSGRYFVAVDENGLILRKETDSDNLKLDSFRPGLERSAWHDVKIMLQGRHINLYVNDILKISYTDRFNHICVNIR